jgi:hypothetical protein
MKVRQRAAACDATYEPPLAGCVIEIAGGVLSILILPAIGIGLVLPATSRHTPEAERPVPSAERTIAAEQPMIDGNSYKAGEAFHVDAGKVHDAKASGGPAVVIANYVIEKGKPATTPLN